MFNANAARFWIYNSEFDELDLLYVYCNNCREIISKVENQLPMDSFSGASLKQKKPYKAWTDGGYLGLSDEAKKRLNKDNLCELWPHFMYIPLIIPTIEEGLCRANTLAVNEAFISTSPPSKNLKSRFACYFSWLAVYSKIAE